MSLADGIRSGARRHDGRDRHVRGRGGLSGIAGSGCHGPEPQTASGWAPPHCRCWWRPWSRKVIDLVARRRRRIARWGEPALIGGAEGPDHVCGRWVRHGPPVQAGQPAPHRKCENWVTPVRRARQPPGCIAAPRVQAWAVQACGIVAGARHPRCADLRVRAPAQHGRQDAWWETGGREAGESFTAGIGSDGDWRTRSGQVGHRILRCRPRQRADHLGVTMQRG